MNIHSFDKKLHNGRLFGTLRRVVAGALTAAMLLPMVPTFGANNEIKLQPIQDETYRPDIEIQSNFVRDDFGFLTGYMELGLRVKTGGKPFRYLAVSLEYDTELYTPVDWSATADEIKIQNMPTDTPKLPYDYYSEELPAQKEEHINFVRAYTGIPDTPPADLPNAALTPEVKSGRHALVSFWASATDRITDDENDSVDGVAFKEMTTIAVIRFKVNKDEMENFTIKKNSDGTGYDIFYKDEKVTNVVELQTEMNKPVANKWGKSVEFADDADIYVTEPDTELALEYRAGSVRLDPATGNADKVNGTLYERRYYYLPGYDAAQNVKVNLVREGKTYTNVDKPNYLNLLDPAVKVPSNVGDADRFSYLTNLIVDKTGSADPKDDHYYVTFPVVSERSFMAGEDILDKLTTIVYVDWDNTLLGTQIVPQNTDVRTLVSDYVAENFIYHDKDDSAYGANDLNNPLALVTTPGDLTPAEAAVKSLERKYNYRGKYPAGGPEPDGTVDATTVDTDNDPNTPEGDKYPLTNKLDYVFYKRPMGHDAATEPDPTTYPGGNTDPAYLADKATWENTWVQPSTYNSASNAYTIEYDVERPFAYGWAKCTQANFEDVWTTMGTAGELNSYTVDGNGVATVVYDGDYDFEFADLKTGFKTGEKTVFLKAIYEPGTELLYRNYRLVMSPQYNKLNGRSSADGGAYSVDVTYERAHTEANAQGVVDGFVRGSQRMRSPAVRQQTTPDLRWETFEKNGVTVVDHDMPSATQEEAADLLTKTTYTNVAVSNKDIVDIQLVLSGRQNKVDYFLIDTYGLNFVGGDQRSDSNFARSTADFTVDNYNYYVKDESEAADPAGYYYNVTQYDTREGSRGFVLYCTLNSLMQAATQYNNYLAGETVNAIDRDKFYEYTPYGTFNDANLRLDAGGTIAEMANQSQYRQKIQAAATAAKAHKGMADEADYWDARLDCARLTYHQLQWFILEGTLYSPTAADAKLWGQCHLHAACAATTSSKPNTWAKLMAAASGSTSDQDTISQLTVNEVENYFHLRSDGNGTQYTSVSAFQADVVAAVATLTTGTGVTAANLTWDQVQYVIDKGTIDVNGDSTVDATDFTAANDAGAGAYWWYDGKTKPTDFAGVLAAADYANTSGRRALVNTIETAFDKMKNPTNEADRKDWIDLTENFATNGTDGTLDTSFTAFVTKLMAAVASLGTGADWGDLQYHILHSSNPSHPADDAEIAGYWWHYGAQKVTDIASLIKAAKDYNSGNTTSFDNFKFTDLYDSNNDLYFRRSFNATQYTAADFQDLKDATLAYVQDPNARNNDWNHFQYYVLHNACQSSNTALNRNAQYYWWKEGNAATAVDMTLSGAQAEDKADSLASALSNAAFRDLYNGNTAAWNNLNETILETGRLINDYAGSEGTFADTTKFTSADVSTVISKVKALYQAKVGTTVVSPVPATLPALTWEEIQDAFLTDPSAADDHWWKSKDSKPSTANPPRQDFNTAKQMIGDVADAIVATGDPSDPTVTVAVDALKAWFTVDIARNLGLYSAMTSEVPPGQDEIDAIAWEWLDYGEWGANCYASGSFDITWCQLQDLILQGGGWMDNPDDSAAMVDSMGWTDPSASWPAVSSLMSMRPMRKVPVTPTVEKTISEDSLTETTKTTTKTWNETTGNLDVTITTEVVTRVPNGETTTVIITTITTTTTIDEETGEPVTTSDTKTTVAEELVTPVPPLAPLPDDPYIIVPDTEIVDVEPTESPKPVETQAPAVTETPEAQPTETTEPTEPPAESTVTPEETPSTDAGDKTESTGDEGNSAGANVPTSSIETDPSASSVGADVPIGPEGNTSDPPAKPTSDPPDPGGGEGPLALARAQLKLHPLSWISVRRTKAPPSLIASIFTRNHLSSGRTLL